MTNIAIDEVFFADFPVIASATTAAMWTNFAIASAGLVMNKSKSETNARKMAIIFEEFGKFVPLILESYPDKLSPTFKMDNTLLRKNFNLSGKKKSDPPKDPLNIFKVLSFRKFNPFLFKVT